MLKLIPNVAILALAQMGLAQWCDMESKTNVGGFNLPECELKSDVANSFKLDLLAPSLVESVSLSVRNPRIKAAVNFTVTVDGQWCGQIDQASMDEIFPITCANGGIEGSVVEWIAHQPVPNKFEFCNFNVCGKPKPKIEEYYSLDIDSRIKPYKIDLTGFPSTQSSNWSPLSLAPRGNDGNSATCTVTQPYLPGKHQPWWEVKMGGVVTVDSIKITNYDYYLMDRLGNIMVTVDGRPCGPLTVDGNKLHVNIDCPNRPTGEVLRIQLLDAPKFSGILTVCEVDVYGIRHGKVEKLEPSPDTYTAPKIDISGQVTAQSSTESNAYVSQHGNDGSGKTCTQTKAGASKTPWWTVDMGATYNVHYIKILNREGKLAELGNVVVTVDGQPCGPKMVGATEPTLWVTCEVPPINGPNPVGRELKITLDPAPHDGILSICDVEVFGFPSNENIIHLDGDKTNQSSDFTPESKPSNAINGDPRSCTKAVYKGNKEPEWWSVNLGKPLTISAVEITTGSGFADRLTDVLITVDGHNCTNSLITAAYGVTTTKIDCSEYPTGSEVVIKRIGAPKFDQLLSLCDVNVFGVSEQSTAAPHRINLRGDLATQSSTFNKNTAAMAIDGNDHTHSQTGNFGIVDPWWSVDMGKVQAIHYVEITNPAPFEYLLGNAVVTVDDVPCGGILRRANTRKVWIDCTTTVAGRILKVQLENAPFGVLSMTEIKAYGTPAFILVNAPEVPQLDLKGLEMSKNDAEEFQKWLTITMDEPTLFRSVKVFTGKDFPKGYVVVSVDGKTCGDQESFGGDQEMDITCSMPPTGWVLKVQLLGVLSIKELDVVKVEGFGYKLQVIEG